MGRYIEIIAILAIMTLSVLYRINVFNIGVLIGCIVLIINEISAIFDTFAYFYLSKQFRLVCGSIISTNLG